MLVEGERGCYLLFVGKKKIGSRRGGSERCGAVKRAEDAAPSCIISSLRLGYSLFTTHYHVHLLHLVITTNYHLCLLCLFRYSRSTLPPAHELSQVQGAEGDIPAWRKALEDEQREVRAVCRVESIR